MCKDAPSAPAPDPNIGVAAKLNAETAAQALDFYTTVYTNEIIPRMQRDEELRNKAIAQQMEGYDQQMRISDQQYQFAQDQNKYYTDTFRPVEQRMVQEAMDYDSPERVKTMMGIAGQTAAQQFDLGAGISERRMLSMGINPRDGSFGDVNRRLSAIDRAKLVAGEMNQAGRDVEDRAIALRAGAANFGRNMPNTAASYYTAAGVSNSAAGAAGMNAGNLSSQGMQNAIAGTGVMGQGYDTAIRGNTASGQLYLGQYNAQMDGYRAQTAANSASSSAFWGGVGTFAGLAFADGGKASKRDMKKRGLHVGRGPVSGPGGPVDDKIPAMLSDGEYVLPADTAKKIGKKNLDKLVRDTHTPAAVQRSRGLKRRK
jgi:hypothetical protein